MYLKDPNTKEPSPTLTLLFLSVLGGFVKLFLSDLVIFDIKFGTFSGSDFALVVGVFIANYGHKRQVNAKKESLANQSKEQKDE